MDGYISTYIIYNLVFMPFLFYFMTDKTYPRIVRFYIFYVSSFAILIAVSGLRYKVGADYENYVWIFHNLDEYQSGYSVEWGYYFINKIIKYLQLDEQFVFFVVGFLTLFFIYSYKESNLNVKILVILTYVLVFYFSSFTQIRQLLAMCVAVYGVSEYFSDFKKFKCLSWLLISSLFHSSTLLLIPAIFLLGYIKYKAYYSLLVFLIFVFFFSFDLRDFFVKFDILSFSKFNSYLYSEHYNGLHTTISNIVRYFIKSFVVFYMFFLDKKYFKDIKWYNTTMILNSILVVSIAISFNFHIFHRIVLLFMLSNIFSVNLLLKSSYKYKYLILFFYFLLNFIMYEYFVFFETYYDAAPYQSILDRNY